MKAIDEKLLIEEYCRLGRSIVYEIQEITKRRLEEAGIKKLDNDTGAVILASQLALITTIIAALNNYDIKLCIGYCELMTKSFEDRKSRSVRK